MRKEFSPSGGKFFPYKVEFSSERDKAILIELSPPPPESVSIADN